MSASPYESRPAQLARPRLPVKERRRKAQSPYTPGQFDHLLPIKEHAAPDELKGVSFEVSATGFSLIATELCKDGRTPRRIIGALPYNIDIDLPDGRTASIEVRVYDAPVLEPEPAIVRSTRGRRVSVPRPASLSEFGDDDGAYDEACYL